MCEWEPLLGANNIDLPRFHLPETQNLPVFKELLCSALFAIKNGINPQLIYEGSSGSYFVYNTQKEVIGVFKPKNEEPYGKLNPKWLKWFHRLFFPCCFGRSCIIPNVGYLSEAGAFLVDQYLDLHIVPPTFITYLVSPTFNYSKINRKASSAKQYVKDKFKLLRNINSNLPAKFVTGYNNGYNYLQKPELKSLTEDEDADLQYLLEKLAVLDYIIRNTDRVNNWLLKLEPVTDLDSQDKNPRKFNICLAAIDNGLAFPFKHPDNWRSYPFDWAYLPYAKRPFSKKIKDLILPKLTDPLFIANLILELETLFKVDKGFSSLRFRQQILVMRGQIYNLVHAFSSDPELTPEKLITLNPVYFHLTNEPPGYVVQPLKRRPFFRNF